MTGSDIHVGACQTELSAKRLPRLGLFGNILHLPPVSGYWTHLGYGFLLGKSLSIDSIIETHDQPFLLFDRDRSVVAANSAALRYMGLSKERIIGRSCHALLHGDPLICDAEQQHACPLSETLSSLEPAESVTQLLIQGQTPMLCRARSYPVESADKTLFIALALIPLGLLPSSEGSSLTMVGRSISFQTIARRLALSAQTDTPVLIHGESGTGKELAAEFVHRHSARQHGPFVTVDCTVLGDNLFESQLFGHEKGSFTGSAGTKKGLYEIADGGTLFLDEIGEIPLAMQPKLLRALETHSFRRVGGNKTITADARIVCATNRNLLKEVEAGNFREDLYYRFAVFHVEMPPLRERMEDVPVLVAHFLEQLTRRTGQSFDLSHAAMDMLKAYDFPGNVRELRNLVQLATALCLDGVIGPEHIQITRRSPPAANAQTVMSNTDGDQDGNYIEIVEAKYIADLLRMNEGSRRKVAAIMGISERTLYRKIRKYSL